MSNVIAFPTPPDRASGVVTVDWTTIAFMPLHEMEARLTESQHWNDPLLFGSLVEFCALWLLRELLTDTQAKALGWASLAVARERAEDMLRLLDQHASRCMAARRETLHT